MILDSINIKLHCLLFYHLFNTVFKFFILSIWPMRSAHRGYSYQILTITSRFVQMCLHTHRSHSQIIIFQIWVFQSFCQKTSFLKQIIPLNLLRLTLNFHWILHYLRLTYQFTSLNSQLFLFVLTSFKLVYRSSQLMRRSLFLFTPFVLVIQNIIQEPLDACFLKPDVKKEEYNIWVHHHRYY